MSSHLDSARAELAGPELRRAISDYVRRRVPNGDTDDVVQTVLCDALAAADPPVDPTELKRWVMGIARHKVADFHRRASRERPEELDEIEAHSAPLEARSMVEWAERQVDSSDDQKKTLDWMAREGEGEKLESIAADESVPAARVRQRVSRMRRWMRQRWTAELAAVAALVLLGVLLWRWLRTTPEEPLIAEDPVPAPTEPRAGPDDVEEARKLRTAAIAHCAQASYRECLERLDEAAGLDPEGDQAPAIVELRREAAAALDQEQRELEQPQEQEPDKERLPQDSKEAPPPVAPTAAPVKPPAPKAPPPTKEQIDSFAPPPESKLDAPIQKQAPPPSMPDEPFIQQPSPQGPPPTKAPPPTKPQPPPEQMQQKLSPKGLKQ